MRETTFPYFKKVPKITNSVTKITIFQLGGISKYFFLDHFTSSFLGQNGIFGYRFHIEDKTDVWIRKVRRVKQFGFYLLPTLEKMYTLFFKINSKQNKERH